MVLRSVGHHITVLLDHQIIFLSGNKQICAYEIAVLVLHGCSPPSGKIILLKQRHVVLQWHFAPEICLKFIPKYVVEKVCATPRDGAPKELNYRSTF